MVQSYFILASVKRVFSLLALLFPAVIFAAADSSAYEMKGGKWGFELNYQTGPVLRHSKKIKEVPRDWTQGFELDYFRRSLGQKPWMKSLNYPEYGIALNYWHIGNPAVFGDAVSLMGYAKFFVVRSKVVNAYVRLGGGLGVVTKYYDYTDNPRNNILGGPLNMAVQLRVGLDWKIHPQVQLVTAGTFSHFSNASAKLPNYGMNIASLTVGIKYYPKLTTLSYNYSRQKHKHPNEVMIKYGFGLHEAYGIGGSMSAAHVVTAVYARYTSYGNKVFGGVCMEYFPSVRNYLVFNESTDKKSAVRKSFNGSVYFGDELMLGRVGMFFGMGVYFVRSMATASQVYFKVGGNYYYAQFGKDKQYKLFVGMNVKSHLSIAQYWEVATGACF